MTKDHATVTNESTKPVRDWENAGVKGLALCGEDVFQENMQKVRELRDRQAAYLDSLPSDPPEAIRAALKLMHPPGDEYPEGIEEALHLSHALAALVKDGDLDEGGFNRDAALYVADRVAFAMHRATRQLDRISDILGNPGRIERDR